MCSTKGSRPKELVITIDLPECVIFVGVGSIYLIHLSSQLSAKDLALDVTKNRLELECAAHDYRLDVREKKTGGPRIR